MSSHEYRMVAIGWFGLIVFLTVFWYATLQRLTGVLKEHVTPSGNQPAFTGAPSVFVYLMRGQFKKGGDERLVALCLRLRQLLYGYLGVTGAYVVFLVIMHPRY